MPSEPLFRRYRRFLRPDPARDVDEELAFHLAMRIEEFRRAGMTESEAQEQANRRFGALAAVREECYELGQARLASERRADRWEAFRQDFRLALRTLSANRGFAIAVSLTIAIGIGANAAVFSVAYGTLLRPLPFRDAGSLVRLWSKNAARRLEFFSVSPADYRDWTAQPGLFSATAAFEREHDATLVRDGAPETALVTAVSPGIFSLLGTPVLRGRTLTPDDARPGAPAAAVISYGLWHARFGADPSIVGRELSIDGAPVVVVGVMPARFAVPGTPADIWTPLAAPSEDHGFRYLRVLVRLRPGVPAPQVLSQLDQVADRLAREHPGSNRGWTVNSMPVVEMLVGSQFKRAVIVLVGVVALVLLIACANAANLQLVRAAARRHEMAVRSALGAGRARLTRQLLTESLALSLVAAPAGLLLARGGIALLRTYGAGSVPRLEDVRLDAPALAFTMLITLGSALLFGLVPALRTSRAHLGDVLNERGRSGGGLGRSAQKIRAALVVAEVSMSLLLLVGAGLLMRSFLRLQSVDVGFDARNVAIAPIRLPAGLYPDAARRAPFFAQLLERASRLPGVTSAGLVSSAPFSGPNSGLTFVRADQPVDATTSAPDADYRVVSPGYVRTLGLRLLRGRDFTAADRAGAPNAVLVNETLARRVWPGEDPIGRSVRIFDIVRGPVFEVVGVVSDARYQELVSADARPMMYFSSLAQPDAGLTLVLRAGGAGNAESSTLATALRAIVGSIDPRLPPPAVTPLAASVDRALAIPRFASVLFGVFAGTALALAAMGIYGVMAYLVRLRTQELGIRIALGAPLRSIVAGVVGSALRLTLIGITLGMLAAWRLTGLIATLLFQVPATDYVTFAGVALLLTLVAVTGSLLPARRATQADALAVLRTQ